MEHPKAFISYSWDSDAHKMWVMILATKLRANGVAVFLDQWDTFPGIDLTQYMESSVREVDYVILVCTPRFSEKANSAKGGVGYEKLIITGEIYSGVSAPGKFVPLLREGTPQNALPSYLKSKLFIDFRDGEPEKQSFEELLRHLHKTPKHKAPPIGSKPVFGDALAPYARLETTTVKAKTYCSKCGKEPGTYSSCLGGNSHSFMPYPTVKAKTYCSKCGKEPGTYSSCLGGNSHSFMPYPTQNIFCTRCGKIAGDYSSCLGGNAHSYKSFRSDKGLIYCSKCGKPPGSYSSCLGGNSHNFEE